MENIHAMYLNYTEINDVPCIVSNACFPAKNHPKGINGLNRYFLKSNVAQLVSLQKAGEEDKEQYGYAIYTRGNLEGTEIMLDGWGNPILNYIYGREQRTKIKNMLYPELNKTYRKRVVNMKAFELDGIEYTYEEATEMGYERCDCCGEWHKADSLIETDNGDRICEECKDEHYFYCEDCGALELWDDAVSVHTRYGEIYVCERCSDDYPCCMDCGERYIPELMEEDSEGEWLCTRCRDYYYICEECGRWVSESNVYTGDDDYYYCEACYAEHHHNLHDYGYKPEPIFLSTNAENTSTKFYMGVELEIDDGDDVNEAIDDLECAGGSSIYMKHDGSLGDSGIEIVTHPATLDYHMYKFPWKKIIEAAKNNGYSSHDAGTCGLHVHVGREELGNTEAEQNDTVKKVIILVERYWGEVVNFSRRKDSQINEWASRPDIHDWFAGHHSEEHYRMNIAARYGRTRYTAINVDNYNTIEFRVFRGTLNYTTLIATLQFVQTLVEYAKFHSYEEVESVSFWRMFAFTRYCELRRYLEKRNLLGEGESYDKEETMPAPVLNVDIATLAMAV